MSKDTTASFEVTLTLPKRVVLGSVDGKPVYWDLEATVPLIGAKLVEVGGRTVLTNAYNGGGSKATDAEKVAARQKKLDAWARGEFNVVERGETAFTGMREAFLDEFREATGASQKQAEAFIADAVHNALGKDAKATFSNYLDVRAAELVKAGEFESAGDAREALESHYAKLADDAAKARAKTAAKLEAPKLDLSAFKKAK